MSNRSSRECLSSFGSAAEGGMLLVELLVASGIAALVIVILSQAFLAHSRYHLRLQRELADIRAAGKIETLAVGICRASQEVTGLALPRIAREELRDLENHRVSVVRPLLSGSDSISVALFEGAAIQHREHLSSASFCGDRVGARSSHSALILTATGWRVQRIAARQSRCALEISCPCRSQYRSSLAEAYAIVPLQDVASYYVSSEGTLRRKSLLSRSDQPLLYGVAALQFEIRSLGTEQLLHTRFQLDSQREWQYVRCSLGRRLAHRLEAAL